MGIDLVLQCFIKCETKYFRDSKSCVLPLIRRLVQALKAREVFQVVQDALVPEAPRDHAVLCRECSIKYKINSQRKLTPKRILLNVGKGQSKLFKPGAFKNNTNA